MLREERRSRILNRIRPLVAAIDAELHLVEVILDSTRQELAFVLQRGETPYVVGMLWIDFVSNREAELQRCLKESLAAREEATRLRRLREEEEEKPFRKPFQRPGRERKSSLP
jgi:hypothetical protein